METYTSIRTTDLPLYWVFDRINRSLFWLRHVQYRYPFVTIGMSIRKITVLGSVLPRSSILSCQSSLQITSILLSTTMFRPDNGMQTRQPNPRNTASSSVYSVLRNQSPGRSRVSITKIVNPIPAKWNTAWNADRKPAVGAMLANRLANTAAPVTTPALRVIMPRLPATPRSPRADVHIGSMKQSKSQPMQKERHGQNGHWAVLLPQRDRKQAAG